MTDNQKPTNAEQQDKCPLYNGEPCDNCMIIISCHSGGSIELPLAEDALLTADQRAKVISLCEAAIAVMPNWNSTFNLYNCPSCQEGINADCEYELAMEKINHTKECLWKLAKQLLEEFKG